MHHLSHQHKYQSFGSAPSGGDGYDFLSTEKNTLSSSPPPSKNTTSFQSRLIILGCFILGLCIGGLLFVLWIDRSRSIPADYLYPTQQSSLSGDDVFDIVEEEIESLEHAAARDKEWYYQRLNSICSSYPILCAKVSLKAPYDDYHSFYYKALAIFAIARIDSYADGFALDSVIEKFLVYDQGGRRGSATWDTITMYTAEIATLQEFMEVAVHELGHIIDLGAIQGRNNTIHHSFTEFGRRVFSIDDRSLLFYQLSWDSEQVRKRGSTKNDFCSGYGQTNPFEDFSECFNLYMNHHALFRTLARSNTLLRQKYNYIARLFDGKYLYENKKDLTLIKSGRSFYVFDTTKIHQQL